MNLRLTEIDMKFLKELSNELNISLSDAVRECINFTFIVAPVLKEITIWDAIANINPEFLEEISQMKVGGMTNGKRIIAAEPNKKI
jgi:hypothetical protein